MLDQKKPTDFLRVEGDPLRDPIEQPAPPSGGEALPGFEAAWGWLERRDLAKPVLRLATPAMLIAMALLAAWALRGLYLAPLQNGQPAGSFSGFALPTTTPTPTMAAPVLPEYDPQRGAKIEGVARLAEPVTIVPSRPRVSVIPYTVQEGDTVFGIAERFGLNPETILWANSGVLSDNPHRLQPGQVLNILPVNGTYHKWSAGESLQKVAEFYRVSVGAIVEWPGNPFDVYATDLANPGLQAGAMLIIPGGQREMIDYGPPRIPRENPAVARTYGPGHCGQVADGAIGGGTFIWPAAAHRLSGYDYSPAANHWGIDIDGDLGTTLWAVDHGVVVYAGWSDSGYGNLVVVDHGNGWQSLYAHLSQVYVGCGESVYQGTVLGEIGATGNSSGPHLHFELLYGSARVSPWDFLQ